MSSVVSRGIGHSLGSSVDEDVRQAAPEPEHTWRKTRNTFLEFYTVAGEGGRSVGSQKRSVSDSALAARRMGAQTLEAKVQVQLEKQTPICPHAVAATSVVKEEAILALRVPIPGGLSSPASTAPGAEDETPHCSERSEESSPAVSNNGEWHLGLVCADWGYAFLADYANAVDWQHCLSATSAVQVEPSQQGLLREDVPTVMIRNICCSFTKAQIATILDKAGLDNTYIFIHLPISRIREKRSNRGYAFVGFKSPEFAERCWPLFSGRIFGESSTSTTKLCWVSWAHNPDRIPFFARKKVYKHRRPAA